MYILKNKLIKLNCHVKISLNFAERKALLMGMEWISEHFKTQSYNLNSGSPLVQVTRHIYYSLELSIVISLAETKPCCFASLPS